jgi:hypothetical protein
LIDLPPLKRAEVADAVELKTKKPGRLKDKIEMLAKKGSSVPEADRDPPPDVWRMPLGGSYVAGGKKSGSTNGIFPDAESGEWILMRRGPAGYKLRFSKVSGGVIARPLDSGKRIFYAETYGWDAGLVLSQWGLAGSHLQVYEPASGKQVGFSSEQTLLPPFLWFRVNRLMPGDDGDNLGELADPETGLDEVDYRWLKANCLLGGALAWGRLNRRYFLQVLWLGIPLWQADLPDPETSGDEPDEVAEKKRE